jgi:hypothetical protein
MTTTSWGVQGRSDATRLACAPQGRARRVRLAAALACASLALPARAAAQMCPPPVVALVLHDARGALVGREAFDSVTFVAGPGQVDKPKVSAGRVPAPSSRGERHDSVPAVLWGAHRCTAELVSATLWSRGRAMHLHPMLILQTVGAGSRPRTPHAILLEVPPFQPGHWFMRPCGIPIPHSAWVTVPRWQWRRGAADSPRLPPVCVPNLQEVSLPDLQSARE